MYATTLIEEIPAFLGELPDYFVDFQNAKNAYGSEETWSAFQRVVSEVVRRDGFLGAVLDKCTPTAIETRWPADSPLDRGTLKAILNL